KRLRVAVENVVFGLLGAIDLKNLIAAIRKYGQTLAGLRFQKSDKSFTFLSGIAFGELQSFSLHDFLKTRIERECRQDRCFNGHSKQPEGGLNKAQDAEGGYAKNIHGKTPQGGDVNAYEEGGLEITPHAWLCPGAGSA